MPSQLDRRIGRALKRRIRIAMQHAVPRAEQGPHIDPVDHPPADPTRLGRTYAKVFASPEMAAFARCLRHGELDVRASVLDDLATYYDITPEEARNRCLNWEELSVKEWQAANSPAEPDLSPDEGRIAFYRTMNSWSFDLLWWAYLQAEGHEDAASVIALRFLQQRAPGRRHLDFGAGVGATSQLFLAGGWASTLADISSTLLAFARFRLERRGDDATYIDLAQQSLPAGAYDAITAIDTLAHVPDITDTARDLHTALGTNGILIANFDIRAPAAETAWHLYDDDLRARYELCSAGFRPIAQLGYGLVAYQKVDDTGIPRAARLLRDWVTLASPPRRWARRLGRPVLRYAYELRQRRRPPADGLTDRR